ncbi:hypothetical protein [Pseudoalteromonas denitrificans]|uniref:Lipoprotein n=1 Tax=Pseudoalteromonas denitrificans DSM 6059 TaxID=1123010 RepID=A0A1I1NRT2_9GAMM|nr:hypothetical protein [Pseudoalteromonas denitrificans]SFD00135.1 hypothetical protein SAMN02745724_03150 [Pseudoalteromonas denitrificans DSM 6059]
MKKYVAFLVVMLAGCGTEISKPIKNEPSDSLSKVMQAVDFAKSHSDYRLYMTLGRKQTIPGFENKNFDKLKNRCGLKAMKGTGDVFKSADDKKEKRLRYQFARQFNEIMFLQCIKNS